MAWSQLSINRPHLVYIILGGFTSIFMLCSLFIKEKLYIGEATVATVCGVIFGPHAANLINPFEWGNTDQITLEFSRIVLVVQCFAVGVELPKAYMERHWRSVVLLLVPVMTFGWLITSLFVWWMIEPLNWLEALCVAACVTATDPVLASSVVGKGKFAKRVPKHLRDVLSAESGCNDGMAFPFIYLSLYLIHYHLGAREVVFHWFCFSILYECVFGAFFGVMVGYIGRRAIRLAERKGIIDRESFLVFYFVLALFCAGSGSLLGMDDLLIGFAAGVGFSNDGWFTARTEESHVSNVIDLLINLAYFVYFGTIIPWDQYNAPDHGLVPWKLVILAILVILFRRIPAMLLLKPLIPDIKTWREALFAGHFGPIGVGAIFVAILARAELETGETTPLAVLPGPEEAEYNLIWCVWPVVTFLVIASIVVHGSSIAVFTLGKRINTLTITLTYTQDNEKSSAWMNRLPRISSQSRSMSKMSDDEMSLDLDVPPGQLPPIGIPKLALRRQKEDENDRPGSRSSSLRPLRRRKKREYGGPISQSAITPARRSEPNLTTQESGSDTLNEKSEQASPTENQPEDRKYDQLRSHDRSSKDTKHESGTPPSDESQAEVEAFEEGHEMIIEDEEGNVLETVETGGRTDEEKAQIIEEARKKLSKDHTGKYAKHKHKPHKKNEGEEIEQEVEDAVGGTEGKLRKAFDQWKGFGKRRGHDEGGESSREKRTRGPAHAYQFGNTIIVEDEDGEVIKKYTIPTEDGQQRRFTYSDKQVRQGLQRMGTWVGIGSKPSQSAADTTGTSADEVKEADEDARETSPDRQERGKTPMKSTARTPGREKAVEDYFSARGGDDEEDDGLRLTISRTDRYGLTGLQKRKHLDGSADEIIAMGGGRRLSTRDFIKQMQALDPKAKVKQAEASSASEELVREVKRDAHEQSKNDPTLRPSAKRFESTTMRPTDSPIEEDPDAEDDSEYNRSGRGRARSDVDPLSRGRPGVVRTNTGDSEHDVPVHNTRSTIARHGRGLTAAEQRRQRMSMQAEGGRIVERDDEDEQDSGVEQETAAERRRRLAALGIGADESSSESSEEETPRRPRDNAVYEPGDSPAPVARKKIQWGGERGREAEKSQDESADDHAGGSSSGGGGGMAKKLRGFLKK